MNRMRQRFYYSLKQYLPPAALGLSVFLLWELVCHVFSLPEYLVPAPSTVFLQMYTAIGYLLHHSAFTFVEALTGLSLSFFLGFTFGALFAHLPFTERMALPYFVASQAVPIVAIAPLFILWFGGGFQSKVAMAALICFFPITVSTRRGLASISTEQLDLFRVHGASRWQIFTMLRLPASAGHVFTGLRVSAALAMIGAIVAEYAGSDRGIGYVIMQSSYRLDTPLLFAAIAFSALGGLSMFGAIVLLEKVAFARYTQTD